MEQQPLVEIEYKPQATIMTILAEHLMDETAINQLRDTTEPILTEKPSIPLIMDFSSVRALCSGAIGYLVALKKRIESRQGRLIICCVQDKVKGTSNDKFIYEIFKIVNLDRYFEMSPSVPAALRLLEKQFPTKTI